LQLAESLGVGLEALNQGFRGCFKPVAGYSFQFVSPLQELALELPVD
jgi:hypothetical protein